MGSSGIVTTTTGSDGSYNFSSVQEGSYAVSSAEAPGFVRATPNPVYISVSPDGSASASFGFQGQGTVSGLVFNDTDGDGLRDFGEDGIGGVLL